MNVNNITHNIFKKDIYKITLKDVKNFFSIPQIETGVLEFKSGGVEIIDLYKEVAAFLNTEGGILILGAPKEKSIKNQKICEGELTYSNFLSKDWLSQKISTNIFPPPIGIRIKQISYKKGSLFIIEVPQSLLPPHQSMSDGRYYIRIEGEAKPAPHGIVQALFDKRRAPLLSAKINIENLSDNVDNIELKIINKSNIPANKVNFIINLFNIDSTSPSAGFDFKESEYLADGYTLHKSTDNVLVRFTEMKTTFDVKHKKLNYIVMAAFWSLESDFQSYFWTYNPNDNKIVNEGDYVDSKINIIEAIRLLNMK